MIVDDSSVIEELREHFKKHNRIKEYSAHSCKIHSVAWSCDGRRLASGSFDKAVAIFQLDNYKLVSFGQLSDFLIVDVFHILEFL